MKRQERIDRIELMRTYIRIIEAGSLSAAAGQMETTQATVSRRLQSLEGLLGVKLILRTTHAMKLTDDGERCYRHARQLVDAWLALEDGTVFFETKAGPYVPLTPEEKAAFAPPEGDPRAPEYLAWLKSLCTTNR